ncbi:MAG: hypothetical protein WBA73_16160 [Devosia sp.]
MARTLIGSLILRLKQEGAAEAKRSVTDALSGIEGAARRMNTGNWGSKFDEALRRLKVTPAEHAAIVQSWGRLQTAIDGKMTGPQKSAWRTGVLGHLASIRAEIDHTNTRAKALGNTLRGLGNFATIGIGGLGAYGAYRGVRGGVNAAFEQQRVEAQGHFAGLSEGDQGALKSAAEELSAKYGLSMSNVLQALQEAAMSMPDTASALAAADDIARLLVGLETRYGPDGAVAGAYDILKGLDNVGMNQSPEEIHKALDAFLRAQYVLGADFSPAGFKQMLQYARIAGKSLDDDFLLTWLPIMAAETAGADAGTKVRASFDQLIIGRASEESEKKQKAYGLRTDETGLVGQDLYAQNPILWANEVLLPALKAHGVNTDDPVQLGQAIGEITGNRQSADFLASSLISFQQYIRLAMERMPAAFGLNAADEIRDRDPFATVQGLVNSLCNLSGARGEPLVPVIIPALSGLSGAIEGVAASVRGAEGGEVGIGALATVAAGLGALTIGKVGVSWIMAGPSLQTAAVMLQGAATSLGGAGVGGAAGSTGKKGGWLAGTLGWAAALGIAGAPGFLSELVTGGATSTEEFDAQVAEQGDIKRRLWEMANGVGGWINPSGAVDHAPVEATNEVPGLAGMVHPEALTNMGVEADKTKTKLEALNTTLKPVVDLAHINALVALLRTAIWLQGQLGAAPGSSGVSSQINASYSDFGVAP